MFHPMKTFVIKSLSALALTLVATTSLQAQGQLPWITGLSGQWGPSHFMPYLPVPNDTWIVNIDGDAQGSFELYMVVDEGGVGGGTQIYNESVIFGSGSLKDDNVRDILRIRIKQWRSDLEVIEVGDTTLILDEKRGAQIKNVEIYISVSSTTIGVKHIPPYGKLNAPQRFIDVLDVDPIASNDVEGGSESTTSGDGVITFSVKIGVTPTVVTVNTNPNLSDAQLLTQFYFGVGTLFPKYGPLIVGPTGWAFVSSRKRSFSGGDSAMNIEYLRHDAWLN